MSWTLKNHFGFFILMLLLADIRKSDADLMLLENASIKHTRLVVGNGNSQKNNPVCCSKREFLRHVSFSNNTEKILRQSVCEDIKSFIDPKTSPCENFYKYACGNFVQFHKTNINASSNNLNNKARILFAFNLRRMLGDISSDGGSVELTKLKVFYKSCMDTTTRNTRGTTPLFKLFSSLGGWHLVTKNWDYDYFDWVRLVGKIAAININILISLRVEEDDLDPDRRIITIKPKTLRSKALRLGGDNATAYKEYIYETLLLLNVDEENARKACDDIIKFEEALSEIKSQDSIREWYNIKELNEVDCGIDWIQYFNLAFGRKNIPSEVVKVYSMRSLLSMSEFVFHQDSKTVANYIFWKLTSNLLYFLDNRFEKVNRKFASKLKTSIRRSFQDPFVPTLKQIVIAMPLTLEKGYTSVFVSSVAKDKVTHILKEMKDFISKSIECTDWINDNIKSKILEALVGLKIRIGVSHGLTEKMIRREAEKVHFEPDQCFENVINMKRNTMRQGGPRAGSKSSKIFNIVTSLTCNSVEKVLYIPVTRLHYPFYEDDLERSIVFGIFAHELFPCLLEIIGPINNTSLSEFSLEGQAYNETEEAWKFHLNIFAHIFFKSFEPQLSSSSMNQSPDQLFLLGLLYPTCEMFSHQMQTSSGMSYSKLWNEFIRAIVTSKQFSDAIKCSKTAIKVSLEPLLN